MVNTTHSEAITIQLTVGNVFDFQSCNFPRPIQKDSRIIVRVVHIPDFNQRLNQKCFTVNKSVSVKTERNLLQRPSREVRKTKDPNKRKLEILLQ